MNQQYADHFHSIFGSHAITVLNKFFSSSKSYKTDDACAKYADHMLWKNHFIYLRARKDNPNIIPTYITYVP